jgi:hypothetical protein
MTKPRIDKSNNTTNKFNNQTVRLCSRKSGTIPKEIQLYLSKMQEATSIKVATKYKIAKAAAAADDSKVKAGTLNGMIKVAINGNGLHNGCIESSRVISLLKRNNVSSIAHQKVSPLIKLEPLLVSWCLKMAQIGMALSKPSVIELAKDLILDTELEAILIEYKKKRKLQTTNGKQKIIRSSWYKGVMKCNKEVLRRGCCKARTASNEHDAHTNILPACTEE